MDEELATLSMAHRLLFIGLWTMADREGRLEDRPRRIQAEVFPYEAKIDVPKLLADLVNDGYVRRYTADGRSLLDIPGFKKHQRPHHTERASELASYDERSETDVDSPLTHVGNPAGREGNGDKGKEGKGVSARADARLLFDAWNEYAPHLPRAVELNEERRRHARARLEERPLEEWVPIIRRLDASEFCRGSTGWRADFDFLLKPGTAAKVLEGKYDKARSQAPPLRAVGGHGAIVPGVEETRRRLAEMERT